uniref:ZmAO-1 n=1 Tax=Arundo donax TaxID=35708 RepID=A0A0A9A394_ARUDO
MMSVTCHYHHVGKQFPVMNINQLASRLRSMVLKFKLLGRQYMWMTFLLQRIASTENLFTAHNLLLMLRVLSSSLL